MEKTQDRRIRKTKLALRDGLLELLSQKSITEISVKELTDSVDLNRGTFYLHYKDIYDLLEQIEEDFFEEFSSIMKDHPVSEVSLSSFLEDIFSFLKENAALVSVLLNDSYNISFINKLKQMIQDNCFFYWSVLYNKNKSKEFNYFYAYMLNGCIGLFQYWLQNGLTESPQEMAIFAENIILNGVDFLK